MVGHIPDSTVAVAAVSLCRSPINLVICVMRLGASAYRRCLNADRFVRMAAMLIFYFSGHRKKYAGSGADSTAPAENRPES